MRLRLPLYGRALALLAVNVLLLLALLLAATGWNGLLSESTRNRLRLLGDEICLRLSAAPPAQWPALLAAYDTRYGLHFSLGRPQGPRGLPPRPGPDAGPGPDGPPPPLGFDRGRGPPGERPPPGMDDRGPGGGERPEARIVLQRSHWLRGPYRLVLPGMIDGAQGRHPLDIVATADSLPALLRFLGLGPWLVLAFAALALSALLWAPFVIGMARSVRAMQAATGRIAEGRFEVRVADAARGDELGALATAINEMAARLDDHARSQQQFLADVAHEITSPLARIRFGLGLLESQLDPAAATRLQDVQEDVQQMAALLDELLLYSRAALGRGAVAATATETLDLDTLVQRVLAQEGNPPVTLALQPGLQWRGPAPLLLRALANLLRNALRHGGGTPVTLYAQRDGALLRLSLRDGGPGVPETLLPRLGEAFFRPDPSRERGSGGHGLGLAIVRRCAEACGGELRLRNRPEGGFEAELELPAQADS